MGQIGISDDTHQMLRELAHQEGVSEQLVLAKALAEYRKKRFFDSLDNAFGALKNDPKAWSEEQEERKAWSLTLSDGAMPEEKWTERGNVVTGD